MCHHAVIFTFQNGAICLHEAARQGHVSVVKNLLTKGASVNIKTKVCPLFPFLRITFLFLEARSEKCDMTMFYCMPTISNNRRIFHDVTLLWQRKTGV